MEELLQELLIEQKKTNQLLNREIIDREKQEEMLTIKNIASEFGISPATANRMFNDPELPVQRYTTPFKVMRKHLMEYFGKRHDYLSKREA